MSTAHFEIETHERDAIDALIRRGALAPSGETSEAFSYRCFELGALLPARIRRRLHQMRVNGETHLLIKGLPVRHDLPGTPDAKRQACQAPLYYQTLAAVLSAQVGFLYAFSSKRGHALVEDVFPVEGDKLKQVGTNSVQLDWHVEDAFHKAKADYVSLLCLRPDAQARTLLAAARALVPQLPAEVKAQLQRNDYTFFSDGTFLPGHVFERNSYVLEPSEDPEFVFDPTFTRANSEAAQAALHALAEQIERNHHSIVLDAGDLLIFDNRRVAHSRTEYQPRYDGSDRWLLRSLMVESVWKLKDASTGEDKLIVA